MRIRPVARISDYFEREGRMGHMLYTTLTNEGTIKPMSGCELRSRCSFDTDKAGKSMDFMDAHKYRLPVFVREGTVEHRNRFAVVNCEFAAYHWDYDVAKSEGYSAPFSMAALQLAFFHAMLRDWMGEGGRIDCHRESHGFAAPG